MLFRSLCLRGTIVFGLAVTACSNSARASTDTVAVLPFFNQTKDQHLEWIGESVAETLRESLTAAGVLALSREDRVQVYKRLAVRSDATLTRATVLRIAEVLDASQVVSGKFELAPPPAGDTKSRGQVKLTANVMDGKRLQKGPQLFEAGPLEDLSLVQSRLAWQCIKYFQPRSAPSQQEYLQNRPPVRVEAVESYIRGLLTESAEGQQKFFLQASRVDPRFSEPAFQLGRMAFEKKDYRASAGWMEKVTAPDSHAHEAGFLLGLCRFYLGDFNAAAQRLEQVANQVPLSEVFNDLGAAQSRQGKPEALQSFKKALEGDEADPDYWFNTGYVQWKTGKFSDATASFRAVLDRTPDDAEARDLLARCQRSELPKSGEPLNGERIKTNFEETVYLQLQAELKK